MAAALGGRVARRDRTEPRGPRVWIDCAARAPAGGLSRRRQRRPGRVSAPHRRRQKRADPRALRRPWSNVGTCARRRTKKLASRGRWRGIAVEPRLLRPPSSDAGGEEILRRSSERPIPAAISPYGAEEAPAGTKAKAKSVSTEREAAATKPVKSASAASCATRGGDAGRIRLGPSRRKRKLNNEDRLPSDRGRQRLPAAAPATPGSSTEATDRPKVSIVPPAMFERQKGRPAWDALISLR